MNNWKLKDLQFIRENYKEKTYKEIGKTLNRSVGAVEMKVSRMGLRKNGISILAHNRLHNILN